MRVNTVSVSYGRKFNLGDYNSLSLEVTLWADLEEGDVAQAVINSLQDQARNSVKAEYGRLPKKTAPSPT